MTRKVNTPLALVHSILDHRVDAQALAKRLTGCEIDWVEFSRLAGDTLLTPALWSRLDSSGVSNALPVVVCEGLVFVHTANAQRNAYISQQVRRLSKLLNTVGIRPIPLKGVALLLDGTYADPAERIMGDMDILIRPDQIPAALQVLEKHDYLQLCNMYSPSVLSAHPEFARIDRRDFRNDPERPEHHLPAIKSGPDDFVSFELHTRVTMDTDETGRWLNESARRCSSAVEIDDVHYDMLSMEYRLLHTLHHAYRQRDTLSLGITDYRHLLDADLLLKDIVATGRVSALQRAVNEAGFGSEFGFFLWQSESILGSSHLPQWKPDAATLAVIEKFRRVGNSQTNYWVKKVQHYTRRRLVRYLCTPYLQLAYGSMPYYRSLPLYARYLFSRLIALARKFLPRRLLGKECSDSNITLIE